jgi:hypothetical protein
MSRLYKKIAIAFTLLLVGCAGKQAPINYGTKRADLRKMGVVVIGENPQAFESAFTATIQALYQCRVTVLEAIKESSSNLPISALTSAGLKQLDDLLVVFAQPSQSQLFLYNLNKVTQQFQYTFDGTQLDVAILAPQLAKQLPDPQAQPPGNPMNVARYLESHGALKEALLVMKNLRGEGKVVFLDSINTLDSYDRYSTALEKKIEYQECVAQFAQSSFNFQINAENFSEENLSRFKMAAQLVDFEKLIRHYTNKKSRLQVRYDDSIRHGWIIYELPYIARWFAAMNKATPRYQDETRVINFQPYFPVMNKLLTLRRTFTKQFPVDQQSMISEFDIVLRLTKPCNDFLELTVAEGEKGNLLYPYTIRVRTKDYQETVIEAYSKAIFNKSGLFAVGPGKLLNGSPTTFSVLYEFLELQP